jgi:hypothetical protein
MSQCVPSTVIKKKECAEIEIKGRKNLINVIRAKNFTTLGKEMGILL